MAVENLFKRTEENDKPMSGKSSQQQRENSFSSPSQHSPIVPSTLYKRRRIGVSTIGSTTLHLPKQVRRNYNLQIGDKFEWYPCETDFPDELEKDILAVSIIRLKKEKAE